MGGMQMMLLGAGGGDRLQLVGYTNSSLEVFPASAGIGYQLTSGGKEEGGTGSAGSITYGNLGDWVLPNGSASQYEVRATLNAGAVSSGTTGSWLALTSTRTWTVTRTPIGTSNANLTIEIRRIGSTTTLVSTIVDITAEVS